MTALDQRKTKLIFETAALVRERGKCRNVVIEALPLCAVVRLKGTRTSYAIDYAAIYHHAARIRAEFVRREKAKAKKAGRK